jgi:hypothetical protein
MGWRGIAELNELQSSEVSFSISVMYFKKSTCLHALVNPYSAYLTSSVVLPLYEISSSLDSC